jgi:hypothetical protein
MKGVNMKKDLQQSKKEIGTKIQAVIDCAKVKNWGRDKFERCKRKLKFNKFLGFYIRYYNRNIPVKRIGKKYYKNLNGKEHREFLKKIKSA